MSISLWLAAPLIGLLLSLFAAGGGMIAVPLLSYGLGMPFKQAVATSLVIVATVSLISLIQMKGWKLIDWRLHRFFALGGLIGGVTGANIGLGISDQAQSILFASLVLLVAWWTSTDHMKLICALAGRKPCHCSKAMLAGIATGLVTGLLGVGAGFLIVPLLLLLGVGSYQSAIAHSLVLIISNSLVATLSYADSLRFDWYPVVLIVGLATLGSWAGSVIAKKYSSTHLQKVFSVVLTLISVLMLIKAFSY
ncbi:MAG: hypothetical protein CO186_09400 [Zetaproteobacteria bacterium CG_4_9_14_3_um_filter_49_83]|nr:MAG: hypothetical protein AUJ56_12870 [Zetaproteobacteria bacterium CG1_02_49_23]PIQ30897.1 MAG: hypothetical protein COW62_10985 [Zetaproteobacteria bacterium CG17_big_fil_post_rev_8_21_14_2_50_50_13]PIV30824.1 MAG: hypothetical protein COS35_04415 [Zetaproteobacteria bacterium CG02_land_8_20_14_3_00_50_9]PIY56216.1 MAG: hypothetical protein COZ00_05250 [Zetaproteobacteria bacterium CG_4_10_14_0_8_um_filter_49_80]PJA34699.1 MAG: hypothetical protein CO186_09400 [Zetaproteobacteria bacterium